MSIEGSVDGEALVLYVEHFLCPKLKHGQVVVMDNLQVHKVKKVRALIEGCGCQLVFLPSYSSYFNPIEQAFRGGEDYLEEGQGQELRGTRRSQWQSALGCK